MVALSGDVKNEKTSISEFENFAPPAVGQLSTDERELTRAKADFGNKPLTVLTRTNFDDPSSTAEEIVSYRNAWIVGHNKIAALSRKGQNIMVPNAPHEIQTAQPDAVVSAVRDVVSTLRNEK